MKQETIDRIRKFSEDRDWDQFHSPANLAKSIVIEAAELLECFQWSDNKLFRPLISDHYSLITVNAFIQPFVNYLPVGVCHEGVLALLGYKKLCSEFFRK